MSKGGLHKGVAKRPKGVANQEDVVPEISKNQQEVLHMLTRDYMTVSQIAQRRQTTTQAVYKIMAKLKQKGLLRRGLQKGVAKSQSTSGLQPPKDVRKFKKYIRLHGQEWNIKLIGKSEHYDNLRSRGNLISLDGNTVRLYSESVEVYCAEDRDFCGHDEQRATALSFQYWNRFFVRLENHLKCVFIKNRSHMIKLVNAHYAEVDNELAKEYRKDKIKLHIYGLEDGKLWFTIDNSWQLHEAETLHPQDSKEDMTKVRAHFNDIRDQPHVPLSEISQYMADTQKQINEISHGLKSVVTFLQSSIPNDIEEKPRRPDYLG